MVVVLLILGDFVQLDGVHLWDNVRIDDGSKISKSIVCTNVHIKRYFLLLARENSRHLATLPLSFPAKCRLRSERKSSVLMTRHHPDPGSASDWLNQISHVAWPMRSTTQIWVVTCHQYGICGSFLRCHLAGKPVVASPNVGCFVRLFSLQNNVI